MTVLDKFLNVMRLNPDDDDDFYNEDMITMMIMKRMNR